MSGVSSVKAGDHTPTLLVSRYPKLLQQSNSRNGESQLIDWFESRRADPCWRYPIRKFRYRIHNCVAARALRARSTEENDTLEALTRLWAWIQRQITYGDLAKTCILGSLKGDSRI